MKALRMKFTRRYEADFAHHFRAGDGPFQNGFSTRARTRGQSRHAGAAARMHDCFFQSIVIIQAMRQRPIGQDSVGGSHFEW
jgi:hypothetical protein